MSLRKKKRGGGGGNTPNAKLAEVVGAGVLGTILNGCRFKSCVSQAFPTMPQLDSLTYFSQYTFLLISFVGTYALVLTFVIPNLVALLKLRQKLNSLSSLTSSLHDASQSYADRHLDAGLSERLASESWYAGVQKSSRRNWSHTGTLMQFTACVRLKKALVGSTLLSYRI